MVSVYTVAPAVPFTARRPICGTEVRLDSQQGNKDIIAYFKHAAQSPFFFPRHAACAVTLPFFLVHTVTTFHIKYAPKFKCPPWLLKFKNHYSLPSRWVCSLRLLQSGLLYPWTWLTVQFPGVSIPRYFSPASDSHFLQIVFHHRPTISLLGFPTDVFPSGIFVNTLNIPFFWHYFLMSHKTWTELAQREYQSISVPYKLSVMLLTLKTMYLFYIRAHCVPHSRHCPPRLYRTSVLIPGKAKVAVCYGIRAKPSNAVPTPCRSGCT